MDNFPFFAGFSLKNPDSVVIVYVFDIVIDVVFGVVAVVVVVVVVVVGIKCNANYAPAC